MKFKNFLILLALLIFPVSVFSQAIPNSVIEKYGLNEKSTFFEIRDAMNQYWKSQNVKNGFKTENGVETKVPYWKIYKRWEFYWEQRVNQKTGEFPLTNSIFEYNKYKNSGNTNSPDYLENWTNLGTNTSTGGYAGLGRINCIAFHPSDANTFWVGSPSGGIWKTTNGGINWTILNNNLAVLGVSDIIIPSDYATSNTIYIATGDRDGGSMISLSGGQTNDNNSIGIYKSTDGGNTWNATGLTYTISQNKLVFKILIHPSNNQILIASTLDGIYKTTDGGTTWTQKSLNRWVDMEFKPGDPNTIYASSFGYGSTYVNISTDNGENWTFQSVASAGRRGEIAVSPADPTVVYLLSANSGGGVYGIYKSTNSGVNWTAVNSGSPAGMLGYYTDGSGGSTGQGSYDWCMAVSPTDANTLHIGGITTWKSTNGGVNWTANTCWTSSSTYNKSGVPVVHADKHILAYQNSSVLFEGNDGGIYKTTNGGSNWTDLSNGLVISQIYRIGVSQTNSNIVLSGLQDNGSKLFNGGSWTDVTGGDGMECIVDYSNANYMYATYVTGTIYRSVNGGVSFSSTISANIPGGQPTGAWVTPYVIDQNNSSVLFAGFDRVWKTTNRGNNWTSASQVLSSSNKLRSLAISPSNSNILYSADQTNMWKTTDGGGTNWTSVSLPSTANYITYIAVKNSDPNTIWITFGGYTDGSKVYESSNGGVDWINISTGLPNIPVMCIVQDKTATDRNVLFAGTDVGVYIKDGSNNWTSYSNGLPNVVVSELEILYSAGGDKLRAGTFGRGLWETTIEAALPVELTAFNSKVSRNSVTLNWTTTKEINNKGFEIEHSFEGSNFWQKIGFVESINGTGIKNYSYQDSKLNSGKYRYRLKQLDFNGNYKYFLLAETATIGLPEKFFVSKNYPNPFNPKTRFDYQLHKDGNITIKIFNVLGQEVRSLNREFKNAGYYTTEFDASMLSSGVYFVTFYFEGLYETRTVLLMK